MMDGERWARLDDLFHRAAALGREDRAAFLARECADDPALRVELGRLLAGHDRAGGFIEEPLLAQRNLEDLAPSLEGRRIGAWRIVREVGRGGMGAVYLAERADGAFEQRVAIKLVKRGMDTDQVLARFAAERRILASLEHPNIARLLDGGATDTGQPWFAMEYIEGSPLDRFAAERKLSVEARLRLFLAVCDAVAHAHAQGVVHRDIKPANLLVTPAGVPKLLDFGIAKLLREGETTATTVTGFRLLTPEYASPEQVEGRTATAASDVYSLGVVLYELLTGASPYVLASRTPQEVAAAVCTTDPEPPSLAATRPLRRALRGDLDAIALTALRKEPARRYPSVAALADDLRRHLARQPVLARGDSASYRAGRFLRRHRTAVAGLAIALGVAILAAGAGAILSRAGADPQSPTLLEVGSLSRRDRVLVADFSDRTGDPSLAAAITEAFRIDLSQSPLVQVLTPRQVRLTLEGMQRPPDVALDDSLAREVAAREGVKAIVTGSVARVAGAFAVSAQLLSARSGEALATVRETAADSTGLLAAVERASRELRRRVGESVRELDAMPKLEAATTASLAALRHYTEGQRLFRGGQRAEAIERYRAAVALDSGFASAHLSLAMAFGSVGDLGRGEAAGDRAVAHQDRLPFLERSFLVASRAYAREAYATAARTYAEVLARFPDNVPAMNNLALVYRSERRFAEAESLATLGFRTDTTIANLLFGVHSAQVLAGRFAAARRTLDEIARRFPGHPIILTEEIQDAAARQDWDRAERQARAQVEAAGADTLQLVDPIEALAGIAMTRGRLAESERLWRRHATVSRAAGSMGRHWFGAVQMGWLELRYRNDPARAVALVDSALGVTPLDSLLPGDRPYDLLARFYLGAGKAGRARSLLAAGDEYYRELGRAPGGERLWSRGLLALADGRREEGLRLLTRAAQVHECTICVLADLGRAREAAGRPAEAIQAYREYADRPWLFRYELDAVDLAAVLVRLGELYEAAGRPAEAAAAYERFLALREGADPELAGETREIRERLGRLRGGEG
ncbi:MAG TPA: protein kinase [Gemmatimonadales bacterium]|nr:protein kinase [Gemmatimonadales bacterium]